MPISRASDADGRRPRNRDDVASATHPNSTGGVPGVATRAAAHRLGAEGLIIEQGAAGAVGLLPMRGQERCDHLVRLVDQLSPIVA